MKRKQNKIREKNDSWQVINFYTTNQVSPSSYLIRSKTGVCLCHPRETAWINYFTWIWCSIRLWEEPVTSFSQWRETDAKKTIWSMTSVTRDASVELIYFYSPFKTMTTGKYEDEGDNREMKGNNGENIIKWKLGEGSGAKKNSCLSSSHWMMLSHLASFHPRRHCSQQELRERDEEKEREWDSQTVWAPDATVLSISSVFPLSFSCSSDVLFAVCDAKKKEEEEEERLEITTMATKTTGKEKERQRRTRRTRRNSALTIL